MTNSCFSKQQWPNTAICLGWRREEFVYSMHWCVPLRGTESSRCFVSAVGGRFSVLNVRCDCPLWQWKQTVEYCISIIQIISEMLDMLVSSCISFNKADKTIRELDRFSLEMSWTMDRCLGNEPFVSRYTIHLHKDTIWICINNYDQLWTCLGSCWKSINLYQPIDPPRVLPPSTNRSIEARVTLYLRGTDAMTSLWRYHMTPAKSPWASHG